MKDGNNKGQKNIVIQKKNNYLNFLFLNNEYTLFLYKKTEKICSAIYLVSNLMRDEEPIKDKLRTISLKMLSSVLSFIDQREEERKFGMVNALKNILELSSLFELSFKAGLVSEMNFSVIKKEIDVIAEELNTRIQRKSGGMSIVNNAFFEVDNKIFQNVNLEPKKKLLDKDIEGDLISKHSQDKEVIKDNQFTEIKRENLDKGQNIKYKGQEIVLNNKNERTEKIINALKQNKEMTVKELSIFVRNYSEKTIQRDLNYLLSIGTIQKKGEKRWSKYSVLS